MKGGDADVSRIEPEGDDPCDPAPSRVPNAEPVEGNPGSMSPTPGPPTTVQSNLHLSGTWDNPGEVRESGCGPV
jgi:hypothetical protein